MIKNYLKIAIRRARKDRLYTIINVFGLAIGLASFLYIMRYVENEQNVDRFHRHSHSIYRLKTSINWNNFDEQFPATPPAVGTAIRDNLAEVEYVTRILPYPGEKLVKIGERIFREEGIMAVDSNFLNIFTFHLSEGNPEKVFTEPNLVVLSQSYSEKYFGEVSGMNKVLDIDGKSYKVSGIIEDSPADSHIQYSILTSNLSDEDLAYFEWSWVWCNLVTYVKLYHQTDPERLEAKFPDLVRNNAGYAIERLTGKPIQTFFDQGNNLAFSLEELSEVYYSNLNYLGPTGSRTFMIVFSVVALTILLLACVNYTNLTTARALKRAKEIGLRKVAGTTRGQLHFQFLMESMLYSLMALLLAVFALEILNHQIASSFGMRWNLSLFTDHKYIWFTLGLALFVGSLSGLYPAFYLSSFNPARAIKGLNLQGKNKSPARNALVVFQFLVSFSIIIFTFSVQSQIRYLRNKDLGFDKENLLVIDNINFLSNRNNFKSAVINEASVRSATLSNHIPSQNARGELFKKTRGSKEDYIFSLIDADEDFLTTYGLKLNTGENFTEKDLTSNNPKIVINEKAKRALEFEEALGERIISLDDGRELQISGVIEDFDYFLSQDEMQPFIIRPYLEQNPENSIQYLTVKIASNDLQSSVERFERIWKDQKTGIPFSYHFYDQIFSDIYFKEIRLGSLLSLFSGLAIAIAILGLIGLISFHTEQLTKSIGIRKVFGATSFNILFLITKDFLKLFIIAFIIAIPIANYAIKDWLETFVNKIDISIWLFMVPGMLVITVALLTIWGQSFKAASANPVEAIRNE